MEVEVFAVKGPGRTDSRDKVIRDGDGPLREDLEQLLAATKHCSNVDELTLRFSAGDGAKLGRSDHESIASILETLACRGKVKMSFNIPYPD